MRKKKKILLSWGERDAKALQFRLQEIDGVVFPIMHQSCSFILQVLVEYLLCPRHNARDGARDELVSKETRLMPLWTLHMEWWLRKVSTRWPCEYMYIIQTVCTAGRGGMWHCMYVCARTHALFMGMSWFGLRGYEWRPWESDVLWWARRVSMKQVVGRTWWLWGKMLLWPGQRERGGHDRRWGSTSRSLQSKSVFYIVRIMGNHFRHCMLSVFHLAKNNSLCAV